MRAAEERPYFELFKAKLRRPTASEAPKEASKWLLRGRNGCGATEAALAPAPAPLSVAEVAPELDRSALRIKKSRPREL